MKRQRTEGSTGLVETPTSRHKISTPTSTPHVRTSSVLPSRSNGPTGSEDLRPEPRQRILLPSKEVDQYRRHLEANPIDLDLTAQLFSIYFNVVHPVWPILYKPAFDSTDFKSLIGQLSKPLVYAICSLARCAESFMLPHEPSTSSAFFFRAATLALQRPTSSGALDRVVCDMLGSEEWICGGHTSKAAHNDERPTSSLESCQAFTILALRQRALGESASAYDLCSQAASMAIDLSLHQHDSLDVDPSQIQSKARLWWGIYVLDKMIACEIGRPVLLRSDDANTPIPSPSESDEFQLLARGGMVGDTGTNRVVSFKSYTVSGFSKTIQLAMIIEKMLHQVYASQRREQHVKRSVQGTNLRLELQDDLQRFDDSFQVGEFTFGELHETRQNEAILPPAGISCALVKPAINIMVDAGTN